eukprot:TRINITY_DN1168_c0_g1_i1.p1 TRINITY_DN1168_c0_g1~~TRINITY_DN1168_c0_g1_i1.p1  ORF type:complete len:186 (+),score=10.42 TRINITY_DN1168_c0_g1_i1:162-719(+)
MKGLLLFFLVFLSVTFTNATYIGLVEYENENSTIIQVADYYTTSRCLFDTDNKKYSYYICRSFEIVIHTLCEKGCGECKNTNSYAHGRYGALGFECRKTLPKIPTNSLVSVKYSENDCTGNPLTLSYYNPNYCFTKSSSSSRNYYCNDTQPFIYNCDSTNCSKKCAATALTENCVRGLLYECGHY